MSSKSEYFLKKSLGEDFFEVLAKTDLWKPDSRTISSIEDMEAGLSIVPRALMSLLISELTPMKVGENKEINLPIPDARIHVNKHERDQYSGEVYEKNDKITEFMYRSVPGVGLVIMSAFELYSMEDDKHPTPEGLDEGKIQKLIDERVALHRMVDQVVEGKLRHRDAVQDMLLQKLTDSLQDKQQKITELTHISKESAPMEDPYFRGMANGIAVADAVVNNKEPDFVESPKKTSPIKTFLDNKKKKNEFSVQLTKSEAVNCEDCGHAIWSNEAFSSCICYGEDFGRKIFLRKSEDGVKIRFSKGWKPENISMLLETLRARK